MPRRAARLRFEDNGVGITPEVIEKVLDPLFVTKSVRQEMALGFSIGCVIVERHGTAWLWALHA